MRLTFHSAIRGIGITFEPATRFVHTSNEPVQELGTGITLDAPLTKGHQIYAVIRDGFVTTVGYQGIPTPNQWFAGPVFNTDEVNFGRNIFPVTAGSILLLSPFGFQRGQMITVDSGASTETANVSSLRKSRPDTAIVLEQPLTRGHAAAVQVSGTVQSA